MTVGVGYVEFIAIMNAIAIWLCETEITTDTMLLIQSSLCDCSLTRMTSQQSNKRKAENGAL